MVNHEHVQIIMLLMLLAFFCVGAWEFKQLLHSNERLTETNRVLALGYANPDAALRLVARDQANGKDAKTKAVLNQIRLAQTRNERIQAERNVAGRGKPPREVPHLTYHSPVDDDIVPPRPEDKK